MNDLYLFQVCDLFPRAEVEALLDQPQWLERYPKLIGTWKSPDRLASSRVLLPGDIVLAAARQCACQMDFYGDADGQTLRVAGHGRKPFRDPSAPFEDIADAKHISAEQAFAEYGADTVWLASEYGQSQKGQKTPWSRGLPSPPAPGRSLQQSRKLLLMSGAILGLIVAVVAWTATNQPLWFWATPVCALLSVCLPLLARVRSNNAPHRDGREASHLDQPSSAPARGRER
jgi:hypothetical protein